MISLLEKLQLNKNTGKNIVDSPLKASIKAKRLAADLGISVYIARTSDNKYIYAVNSESHKIGDKLDDGSIIIEIQK